MKRGKLFFTVFIILAVAMLFTAVGCGDNGQDKVVDNEQVGKDGTAKIESNGGAKDEGEESKKIDPFGKYDPPIEVTFVRRTDDALESNVLSRLEGETIDENLYTRLYEERLGIKARYLWIAKGQEQYQQKFNVAIASGDIPDIVNVNLTQLKQLAENDLIHDVSAIMEYTSPLCNEIIHSTGDEPFMAATFNGKLFGIPQVGSGKGAAHLIWLRTDWLERYGLPAPKTMDDLFNIIKTFVKSDPDGNGEDDTIGLAISKELWNGYAGLEGFFNGYHAYPAIWIEKEGQLVYGSIQPEMRQPLVKLAEMYREGYLDKEFAVKDGGKVAEAPASGRSGVHYGQQWNSLWPLQANRDNDPKADWKAFPIVSIDGEPAYNQIPMGSSGWYAISKNMKHPEALMKMYNLFMEKNYDKDKQEYSIYANNSNAEGIWKLSPVITGNGEGENYCLEIWRTIKEPLKTGNPEGLWGEARANYGFVKRYLDGDDGYWGWNGTKGIEGSWSIINQYNKNNLFLMESFIGAPTPTMVDKMSTLNKMQHEILIRIIMGESSIEEFDKFIIDWNKLGGEAITQEVNDWYQSTK